MNESNQLCQRAILDHSCERHGSGALDAPDATGHRVNPICGDDITLGVRVKDDKIEAIGQEGDGCSISQTPISVVHDPANGVDLVTVVHLEADFDTLMHSCGKGVDDAVLDDLEDGAVFGGVSKYPNRVKCAPLGRVTLKDALVKSGVVLPTVEPNSPEQSGRPDTIVRPAGKKEEAMDNNPNGMPIAADNPMTVQQPPVPVASTESVNTAAVEEALRDTINPELGIGVVDPSLLYGASVEPDGTIVLDMTLTTAACLLTDVIEEQTQQALSFITDKVRIQRAWLPPWGSDKITPEGREQLRVLGLNI